MPPILARLNDEHKKVMRNFFLRILNVRDEPKRSMDWERQQLKRTNNTVITYRESGLYIFEIHSSCSI
jgi:hypothetical protein